jgi:hypothetical protein
MTNRRRPRLPRGLHWDSKSPHIFFSWRDAQGEQHHQSTQEMDPIQAQRFKLDFLERQHQNLDEIEYHTDDLSVVPLGQVSELYFKWKMANNSLLTLARERRMFKNVLKFFGAQRPVSSVKIASPPRRPGAASTRLELANMGELTDAISPLTCTWP